MKVYDPGHRYEVTLLDTESTADLVFNPNVIQFVKREGEGYPGNIGHYPGTNCQELIRVLIDRVKYLDNQISCNENLQIIYHLREALIAFEIRAAKRHKRRLTLELHGVENLLICYKCGHIGCKGECSDRT